MSDQDVVATLDALEALLTSEPMPDPEALAQWRASFDAAVATAERGGGWQDILARARELGARIQQLAAAMGERKEALRAELAHQAAGGRALKGYTPTQD